MRINTKRGIRGGRGIKAGKRIEKNVLRMRGVERHGGGVKIRRENKNVRVVR